MKVTDNHTVRVEYELKVKGGAVIESSGENGPLEYVHGEHRLLPALERLLEGMDVGEEKRGVLPAAEAFGDESHLPARELPKKEFPPDEPLTVGRIFIANATGQESVRFKIVSVEGELVKVRFLHELADRDIEYRVKVLGIEPPRGRRSVLRRPPPPPAAAVGIDTGSIVLIASEEESKS